MNDTEGNKHDASNQLSKSPTGILGFDEITNGGLPQGRPTLVCGSAGSGKTLFAMEFLVRGAIEYNEPGVFISFEETEEELKQNVSSLGFHLEDLVARQKLFMDYVSIEPSDIEETGEFDLDGLFIRIGDAIDTVGAKRVVLDTLEALFAGLPNPTILRAEIRRLFRYLKSKGVTAVVTAEQGKGSLTHHGFEEYVSDCVVQLDNRVHEQTAIRRLRVVKYRGSRHGTNEYPFLIEQDGISVLPITSMGLDYEAPSEQIPSGVPRLDAMLGGGFYRGGSVLVSGTAGTGKTSIAAHFADVTCRRGERCLYFAFEESRKQIMRNMRSIGVDLAQWEQKGLLRFHNVRPSAYVLEMHLVMMHKLIKEFRPGVVVIDPISNLLTIGNPPEVKSVLTRLIDFMKMDGITALFASLLAGDRIDDTAIGVSSLMDTWIMLRDIETNGERNRGLYILKSRGTVHSNQVREFLLTSSGIELLDVYTGADGVMTGALRAAQEAKEMAQALEREQEVQRMQRELARERKALEAKISLLRSEFEGREDSLKRAIAQAESREDALAKGRMEIARLRKADEPTPPTQEL
ncbi:MAG: circadian clock protein KaiC [Desulfobacteraceae bacterium]|nr:circadian clock protein KaiC [Desulfobacteraceae bacterium]